jgi:hypothetical protein
VSEEVLTLNIPINQNTIKKIVALAALTGENLESIKSNIAGELIDEAEFDNFISSKLRVALGVLDGVDDVETPPRPVAKSFAQVEQQANVVDEIAGHSLSGDEDPGELTYQEQVTKTGKVTPPASPFKIEAPDMGNDAEAFLNSALDFEEEAPAPQKRVKRTTSATKQNSGPRVKVSDYTGDEDASDSESIF